MVYRIFSDPKMEQEFLDRFDELTGRVDPQAEANLEVHLETQVMPESYIPSQLTVDNARSTIKSMQEGIEQPIDTELEAIILQFGRPAYFIQNNSFNTQSTPSSSVEVNTKVNAAKSTLEQWITSVGRVNVRNHRNPWEGTGWLVHPGIAVTNRHVASAFAQAAGDQFALLETGGKQAKPELDMKAEYQSSDENIFRMKHVLWIEPPNSPYDVAFLSVADESLDELPQPASIDLMDQDQYDNLQVEQWGAIIGYPARSPYNDAQDQQRIFQGVFNVKRLQPGMITAKTPDGAVNHDASTLGGNSGSVFLDLESGAAIALHWGGLEGERNSAVAAPIVKKILHERVLNLV